MNKKKSQNNKRNKKSNKRNKKSKNNHIDRAQTNKQVGDADLSAMCRLLTLISHAR